MNNPHNTKAYQLAQKDFLNKKGRDYVNPFSGGSVDFNLYERGWSQALKHPSIFSSKEIEQKLQLKRNKKIKEKYIKLKG